MDNTSIVFLCDKDFKSQVKQKAKKKRFTMSTYIRVAIEEKMKRDNQEENNE